MKYKEYVGQFAGYDETTNMYYGETSGLGFILFFQGATLRDLVHEFHESVDDYLDWLKEHQHG